MLKPKAIIFNGLHVFAAFNIRETIIARESWQITDEMLILENLIIFAKNLNIADYILNLTDHPECEVIFYLHLPEALDYRPLITSVTKNNISFPYYFNN